MQLKGVCEKFISQVSASLCQPLRALLSRYDVIFELAEKDHHEVGTLLHRQPFASAGLI